MAGWLATGGLRHYRSSLLADLPEVVHGFSPGREAQAPEPITVSMSAWRWGTAKIRWPKT